MRRYNKGFLFIRHGETAWNRSHIVQGHTDIPLNSLGRHQVKKALKLLETQNIASIVASPLKRAAETASIISIALNLSVHYEADLKERSYGSCEGHLWKDTFLTSDPAQDAEPAVEFLLRVQNVCGRLSAFPGPILVVSHGGVFNAMCNNLCKKPDAYSSNAQPFMFSPIPRSNKWDCSPL